MISIFILFLHRRELSFRDKNNEFRVVAKTQVSARRTFCAGRNLRFRNNSKFGFRGAENLFSLEVLTSFATTVILSLFFKNLFSFDFSTRFATSVIFLTPEKHSSALRIILNISALLISLFWSLPLFAEVQKKTLKTTTTAGGAQPKKIQP